MIAVVMSLIISRTLDRESIYTLKLRRRGVDLSQLEQAGPLREVRVTDAMKADFPSVSPTLAVEKLMTRLRQSDQNGFPVVTEDGEFEGIVTLADVQHAMSNENFAELTVNDISTKSPIVAYPGDSLHDVFLRLDGSEVGRIPVVDPHNRKKLVGVLRRQDILRAYALAVAGKSPKTIARRVP
jgi:CIC family chloride channel protein